MKREKNCRYCGEKIDKNSQICLKCGKDQRNFLKKHPIFIIVIIILILICIAIGIIFSKINSITNQSDSYVESGYENTLKDLFSGMWEDISITSDELIEEYEDDKESADDKYEEMYMEITGTIEKVEELEDRTLKIDLKTNNDTDYKISCYFDEDENKDYDEMKKYNPGKKITAVGCLDRVGKNLKLEYCILGDWEVYYSFDNTFEIDLDLKDILEDAKNKDKSINLSEENIMCFDSDILDFGYSYKEILDSISEISGGEVKITDINEKKEFKNRTITMKINGNEVSINLDKDDACFDETLVYEINKELQKRDSDKMFYYSFGEYDEEAYEGYDDVTFGISSIAYSTQKDIDKLNKVIENSDFEIGSFEKEPKVQTKSI